MKIIFVANLKSPSASGRQRLWALQQCGAEVFILDKSQFLPVLGRFSGPAAKILKQPVLLHNGRALGKALIELCTKTKPDIIWIEWATDLHTHVLNELKQLRPKPLLISFQDDNPWGERYGDKWIWKNYFKVVPLFDLHIIKRPDDIANLSAIGAKKFRIWRHGVYSPLYHPADDPVVKKYSLSFVGTCMDKRARLIEHLLINGIPVHVFGTRWRQRSNLPTRFPDNFHPMVEGEDYANVIRQSQACLGLVSHSNKDEWTMRTFEIPGCARLLVAERTATHEEIYENRKEAIFFTSPEECVDELKHLLAKPALCDEIGLAAYEKCKRNNWMIEQEMQVLLNEIETQYLHTTG
jgi:spore maturation protein CgeB